MTIVNRSSFQRPNISFLSKSRSFVGALVRRIKKWAVTDSLNNTFCKQASLGDEIRIRSKGYRSPWFTGEHDCPHGEGLS